ncbi:MAG: PTS fructose transporter subunit IIA [Pseudomonadota bacterium]
MMIGLLIVTHCDLGKEFLRAAEFIVGHLEAADTVQINDPSDSETIRNEIEKKMTALNRGKGILILTDMFGGTPSNLSLSFLKEGEVEVLTGVNLPMIITIAQYRSTLELNELAKKAQEAGKTSISLASRLLESL